MSLPLESSEVMFQTLNVAWPDRPKLLEPMTNRPCSVMSKLPRESRKPRPLIERMPKKSMFDEKSAQAVALAMPRLESGTQLVFYRCFPNGLPFYLQRTGILMERGKPVGEVMPMLDCAVTDAPGT